MCKTTGLNKTEMITPQIHIYPNPANDRIFIQSSVSEVTTTSIYSTLGDKLLTGSTEIDISALPGGVYILNIAIGNHQFSRKLLKL
jgi:hypothetical protein